MSRPGECHLQDCIHGPVSHHCSSVRSDGYPIRSPVNQRSTQCGPPSRRRAEPHLKLVLKGPVPKLGCASVTRTWAAVEVIAVSVQTNKELVRAMSDQVWNAGQLDRLVRAYRPLGVAAASKRAQVRTCLRSPGFSNTYLDAATEPGRCVVHHIRSCWSRPSASCSAQVSTTLPSASR
jgi:hypothetical protein